MPPHTGMSNKLAHWQNVAKIARSLGAAAKIDTVVGMRQWAEAHHLPPSLEALEEHKTYAIPMDYAAHHAVDSVVLTSRVQVGWILQLAANARKWALHVDGKYKLHHGGWLLVTMGTHVAALRTYAHNTRLPGRSANKVVHEFRPLVYMFTRHQESVQSILFLFKAMELVVRMCAAHAIQAQYFMIPAPRMPILARYFTILCSYLEYRLTRYVVIRNVIHNDMYTS